MGRRRRSGGPWCKIPEIAIALVSVSSTNSHSEFGRARAVASIRAFFVSLKVCCYSDTNAKVAFTPVMACKGATSFACQVLNSRFLLAKLKMLCISVLLHGNAQARSFATALGSGFTLSSDTTRPKYLISDFKKSYSATRILNPDSRRHSKTSRRRTMWSSTASVAIMMSSVNECHQYATIPIDNFA